MPTIEKIYFKKDDKWNQVKKIDLCTLKLKDKKRGVSFISVEGNNRLTNDNIKGFCHIKFKANFVVNNINMDNLFVGQLLQIGRTVIKVTEIKKECFVDCPVIKNYNKPCLVNKQIFFGKVLKEGTIKEKDSIFFI